MMIKKDSEGNYVVTKNAFWLLMAIVIASIIMTCLSMCQSCRREACFYEKRGHNKPIEVIVRMEAPQAPMPPMEMRGEPEPPEITEHNREIMRQMPDMKRDEMPPVRERQKK